jgi:GrpB-like predicted nucleotidyltransferase (UPF0157 family)
MTPQVEAEIQLVPYDALWAEQFEAERLFVLGVIQQYICGPIEHVGSTAVPGLLAKPIIDIMVAVESLAVSRPAIALLEGQGYFYSEYRPDVMHWFCKPSPKIRTHHLHLVTFRSALWNERIEFRDYLREHTLAATEYGDLKRRLAERFRFDREAYTDAKGPFVRRIISLASEKRRASG